MKYVTSGLNVLAYAGCIIFLAYETYVYAQLSLVIFSFFPTDLNETLLVLQIIVMLFLKLGALSCLLYAILPKVKTNAYTNVGVWATLACFLYSNVYMIWVYMSAAHPYYYDKAFTDSVEYTGYVVLVWTIFSLLCIIIGAHKMLKAGKISTLPAVDAGTIGEAVAIVEPVHMSKLVYLLFVILPLSSITYTAIKLYQAVQNRFN